MIIKRIKQFFIGASCLCATVTNAQNTETLYLSGTGLGNTVTWDFYCSEGMNSGKWSKIEVPSQWELQGFGEYTFGRFYLVKGAKPSDEMGLYRYKFKVPADWKDKQVSIVFEGVMTDTEVKINNELAGDIHQGGFISFNYDITDKLKFGKSNELEVKVWKESANKSVNAAERRADWLAVFCFVISANRDVDLFPALSCAQRERTPLFSSSVPGMVKVPSLPALTDAPSSP